MNWVALLNHLPALPEALLLVGACTVMIADTFARDERRALTYWIAQGTLALCLAATLFVVAFTEVKQDGKQPLLRQVLPLQRPVRRRLPVARGEAGVLRRGVGDAGLLAPVAPRPRAACAGVLQPAAVLAPRHDAARERQQLPHVFLGSS
jgi:hypothetical protein